MPTIIGMRPAWFAGPIARHFSSLMALSSGEDWATRTPGARKVLSRKRPKREGMTITWCRVFVERKRCASRSNRIAPTHTSLPGTRESRDLTAASEFAEIAEYHGEQHLLEQPPRRFSVELRFPRHIRGCFSRAAMKAFARAGAGPGERGPSAFGTGATFSTAQTGPVAPSTPSMLAVHCSSVVKQ